MNESIGGAHLFNIFFIVLGVIIAVFATSFVYTKAYRAKSVIIKEIENNVSEDNGYFDVDVTVNEIENSLSNMGYGFSGKECPDVSNISNKELVYPTDKNVNKYCIYRIIESDTKGNVNVYYEILTYMHYDIPFFNLVFPVKGQTRSYRQSYSDIEEVLE